MVRALTAAGNDAPGPTLAPSTPLLCGLCASLQVSEDRYLGLQASCKKRIIEADHREGGSACHVCLSYPPAY